VTSIRVRLLVALLAALGLAAAVMGGIAYRSVLVETEAIFDYQLRQMALSLRDQGEIAPAQAGALADEQLDFVVQVWTVDGRSIYASRAHATLPSRALLGLADIVVNGQTWRTFGVATPTRVIQVAQPRQIRQRLAANAALRSVLPLLLLAPLLAGTVWWLVARTLRPLREVAQAVRERDEQSLQPLPDSGLPDEVAPLVTALNALLQRLQHSLGAQRAFVADAAHELRSPLTALSLQMQLLRRAPDAEARSAAEAQLAAGIERASRGVEQLLALARSEPGAPGAAFEPVDLAELVRQAVADTAPYAVSRGTRFEFEVDAGAGVVVPGDATALAMLTRNLADNAVRYSPPGSVVQVRLAREGDAALLQVDDAGPGIPPEERDRVFDRFYRRHVNEEAGSGLGLAIVQGVAQRHGATVGLGQSPAGGLRVSVRFAGAQRPA